MKKIEKQFFKTGKKLYKNRYIVATEGNLSFRLDDRKIMVTKRGICKGNLTVTDLLIYDISGNTKKSSEVSTEIKMHREVFQRRSDIRAIIHAHPPFAVSLSLAGITMDDAYLPESVLILGAVPTVPYAKSSSDGVPKSIRPFIEKTDVILLERHGSLTIGKTFEEAYLKLEILENTAKILWLAKQVGTLNPLQKNEIRELLKLRNEKYSLKHPIIPYNISI
jgi:L-fuculose-phosphate aldolase